MVAETFLVAADRQQGEAETEMGLGEVGFANERLAEAGFGVVGAVQVVQRVAAVAPGFGQVGAQRDGAVVAGQGIGGTFQAG